MDPLRAILLDFLLLGKDLGALGAPCFAGNPKLATDCFGILIFDVEFARDLSDGFGSINDHHLDQNLLISPVNAVVLSFVLAKRLVAHI